MDYSIFAPACQAGEQIRSADDIEVDQVLVKTNVAHSMDLPQVNAPIVEAIDTDNFATTPLSAPTFEPGKFRHSAPGNDHAPVTGIIHKHLFSIPTTERPSAPAAKPRVKSRKRARAKLRWRDLGGDPEKLQACVESAGRMGGLAWSLNFGIGCEGALLNSQDPARLLSTYISREFRQAFGHDLPYSFVLELCRDEYGFDRLHAHGVVADRTMDLDCIRQALIRAGGKVEGPTWWVDDQLDLQPITGATGWTSYITKMHRWGKVVPRKRHIFNSRQLKQIARPDYEQFGLSKKLSFTKPRRVRPVPGSGKPSESGNAPDTGAQAKGTATLL